MTNQANPQQPDKNIGQNIRRFIAQIRNESGQIEGTAFAVQRDPSLIVTCRHVVEDANGICEVDATVKVYFPQIRHGKTEDKTFTAKVVRQLENYEDDVVVLQLFNAEDEALILPSDVEIAQLGDASQSAWHEFRSYGFPDRDKYQAAWIDGRISSHIDRPEDSNLHSEPVELKAVSLAQGVSGAPVWDLERNLVVGVISELYEPPYGQPVTDGYGVDGIVLSLAPLGLPMYPDYQYPMTASQPPDKQAQENAEKIAPSIKFPLVPTYKPTQPPELSEWAGRVEFLEKLDKDYRDNSVHITGLIGLGGEGKSSIAYRWLTHNALTGDNQPDAAFWWSFYENRSFEQMVEALTSYLYGEDYLNETKGTAQRVNHIGAMALTKNLILVLDGFEVMQEEKGDNYGSLPNKDLVRLLELFAQSRKSFCLVTSRVPLLDFLNHTAYVQRDVTRLTAADGRTLLRNLEIEGDDATLDKIVSDWEGHALTVGLVGSYLRERKIAATAYKKDLFPKIADYGDDELPRYRQVRRILQRYDEQLNEADKAFLKLFSVFRLPVAESAFGRVFRADTGSTLNTALHSLDDATFDKLVAGLVLRRLLRSTQADNETTYSAHPLVQRHYRKALEDEHKADDVQPIHKAAAEHYQETSDKPSRNPTLDDLKPYIEIVYHLCRAGAYDEASDVYWERISQGDNYVIIHKLGAFETVYNLNLGFFPDRDTRKEPQVSKPENKRIILNEVGFCLMQLGRLREAVPFYERDITGTIAAGDYHHTSSSYQNFADLYKNLGELAKMQNMAEKALSAAKQDEDEQRCKTHERNSLAYLAWAKHLQGKMAAAGKHFKMAETLSIEVWRESHGLYFLFSNLGIYHADYLQRSGDTDYARRVSEANLKSCQYYGWKDNWSRCYRVLGDLEADTGNHELADEHYEQALTLAGQIDKVDVRIEAWLARGRWLAKQGHHERAFADLDAALGLALNGGFRLYEADIRVARAWAYKAQGAVGKMGAEAGQALAMSVEMGYHWGQVDAKEVLGG